jgi:putative tricarboxylic transport membrane protein
MRRYGFPIPAAVLGLVLGFTMEGEFRRALMMSLGSPSIFFTRPIAAVLIALTLATLLKPALVRAWGAVARRPGPAAASVRPD